MPEIVRKIQLVLYVFAIIAPISMYVNHSIYYTSWQPVIIPISQEKKLRSKRINSYVGGHSE